jgi:hypothetical protein
MRPAGQPPGTLVRAHIAVAAANGGLAATVPLWRVHGLRRTVHRTCILLDAVEVVQ